MRKFLLLLMVLCLAIVPCMAEEAPAAEEVQLVEYDFGDFTMTFPEDMVGQVAEQISNNEMFFILYQDYDETKDFNMNLNGTWSEAHEDLTAADPEATANYVLQNTAAQFEQMGITVSNSTLIGAALDEQDGKPALAFVYSNDLDYTGAGLDLQITLYTLQGIVSDEAFGTYTFTVSTDDLEAAAPLLEIMDTITWKK